MQNSNLSFSNIQKPRENVNINHSYIAEVVE